MDWVLVIVALAFCWSMGAHYTGACMGMPYALKSIRAWKALVIMAPLALLGAALASHGVEHTVAVRLTSRSLHVGAEVVVLTVAFSLTTIFTKLRLPTSTIQILVFSVAGVALGENIGVAWSTIGTLVLVWIAAPCVAMGLGYVMTLLFDRIPSLNVHQAPEDPDLPRAPKVLGSESQGEDLLRVPNRGGLLSVSLVLAGAGASFVMGSNDVANATGALVATHTFSPLLAGVIGGVGLALGILTWGRPLLNRMAFDIVKLDRSMATAAQSVQALVVLIAVSFGFFTSMNQSLIGAMVGASRARQRAAVNRSVLVGILKGWIIGPGGGIVVAYLLTRVIVIVLGRHVLV
jgi:PiT family inorganic phosphate transporter